jgi:hypothetical protein
MELQKSMAQMGADLKHLADASNHYDAKLDAFSEKIRDKVEDLGKEVHAARTTVKVAAWLIGFFMAILTLVWAIASRLFVPTH